ncbi:GlxA family transcriptional regulator [Mesorhizobium shangrilense]|uniref:GlxA family transcriptional regulator n=1 Tax=Mesorhizobium shangrilense TaxID=460060 RepID=A0ABV2DME3_9HYPH
MTPTPKQMPEKQLKVGFILARSFTLSAFALFVDTLRLASDELDRSGRVFADWQVLSSTRHLVTSSCGIQVSPTTNLADPAVYDYIVVVGGLLNVDEPIDARTIEFLGKASRQKIPLIGLCTGTFILAAAGLLSDHQTCVSWLHYQAFRDRFPDLKVWADRIFNLDRTRGSCAGGSSAADMAASIVRRHIGKDAERNALEVLQIEKARSTFDIQPRRPLAIESRDPKVKAALIMMETHTEDTISIPMLAEAVGVSRRQLERLFMDHAKASPAVVYKRMRLERARYLLLHSDAPLIDIALETGFENTSHFSRSFKESFGQSPTQLRTAAAA